MEQGTSIIAVALAAIGLCTAILKIVVSPLFKLLKENTTAQKANATALVKVSKSMERVAKATTKGAEEAEKRNGHLAELTIQSKKDTIKAISEMKNHHITTQNVDKQTVKKQVKE